MSKNWERVSTLFCDALDLDPAARAAFLAGLEREDPELAAEVASLLRSHQDAPEFLSQPVSSRLVSKALTPLSPLPKVYATGEKVQGFEIVRLLGQGAFSHVYLARDLGLDRMVALKVAPAKGHEAQTMAVLSHDHIVGVFTEHINHELKIRLICMQYVAGPSLRRLIERLYSGSQRPQSGRDIALQIDALQTQGTSFDPGMAKERLEFERLGFAEAVAHIGAKVAFALAHAHQHQVLHLDVKPDNILFTAYAKPMLADFNVSLIQDEKTLRADGLLGGTAGYMAPEHREAFKIGTLQAFRAIGPSADVYALGVVLYELLTGKSVEDPGAGLDLNQCERELAILLKRSCSEKPANRYSSALEFGQVLEGFLELQQIRAATPEPGIFTRFSLWAPLVGLILLIVGPQLIGSAVNILYNSSQIVSSLDARQQQVFTRLILILNPIVYGIGISVLLMRLGPLIKFLVGQSAREEQYREASDLVRRRTLQLPDLAIALTTFGWWTGYLVFPAGIHLLAGPLPPGVFGHFAISFFLAWIVSMTYSFLNAQILTLRVLYPMQLLGAKHIRQTARKELSQVNRRFRMFQLLAGLIPLLAAALMLGIGPAHQELVQDTGFRVLLLCLIASGTAGFMISLRVAAVLSRTVFALTGR